METDGLLDDGVCARLSAQWGRRSGTPAPWVAGEVVRHLLLDVVGGGPGPALREAAAALGVLRARTGTDAAVLLEDVLALRPLVEAEAGGCPAALAPCLEEVLRSAVGALSAERTDPAERLPATRDPLTGLLLRPVLLEALTHEVHSAGRYGAPSLVVLDLDGLTRFMAVHGHLAGDLHLLRMTEIVQAGSRRSDVVGRLGVDQLAVLLPRTDLHRALVVARRVLARALADARAGERADPGSGDAAPRLSVGVGWLPSPSSAQELLDAAESALHRARQAGGRVVETSLVGAPA